MINGFITTYNLEIPGEQKGIINYFLSDCQ